MVGTALMGARAMKVCTQTLHYAKPPDAKAGEVVYKGGQGGLPVMERMARALLSR